MFSGIVEAMGTIVSVTESLGCRTFFIEPSTAFSDLIIGESISINGVCLTVTHFSDSTFSVTAVPETLRLTNLVDLIVGSQVNLERALLASTRMGGHYVQGHVDTVGTITQIAIDQGANIIQIQISDTLTKYIVKKGYITVDGMSLTVVECDNHSFSFTLIPHTKSVTIANNYRVGTKVNIELDIMAKYVEKILGAHSHANRN
jgi:riboflavin synthase